jgi:hypothetical protein
MENFPTAMAIDSLFRDAYSILEEIHGTADHVESISGSVVQCHRTIQMLERIHRDQVRSQRPDVSQDVLGLRTNLDRFIASCNALRYLVNTKPVGSTMEMGCWTSTSRPTFKKRQLRELQEEFKGHQRLLSLALANAIL